MKQVDTGGLTFQEMRKDGKYYVDKSLLIKDMLDTSDRGVFLYIRPRWFGKTTNISMLDAFFNRQYEGNGRVDIILKPVTGGRHPIIMELKTAASEGDLIPGAEGALRQIHDRRYYAGMKGRVQLIGNPSGERSPMCARMPSTSEPFKEAL